MDNDPNNLTEAALPDASRSSAADGEAAVAETLSLTELNSILGKDFKDKATALKSVKDTYAYVGKKADAVATPAQSGTSPDLEEKLSSLERQLFYAANPEYKGHESVIDAMGKSPSEVIGSGAFKTYFEAAKVADSVSKTKSVVASNPRIAQANTHMDTAIAAANSNNREVMGLSLAKMVIEGTSQG